MKTNKIIYKDDRIKVIVTYNKLISTEEAVDRAIKGLKNNPFYKVWGKI